MADLLLLLGVVLGRRALFVLGSVLWYTGHSNFVVLCAALFAWHTKALNHGIYYWTSVASRRRPRYSTTIAAFWGSQNWGSQSSMGSLMR